MTVFKVQFVTEEWLGDFLKDDNTDTFYLNQDQYRELLSEIKNMVGMR